MILFWKTPDILNYISACKNKFLSRFIIREKELKNWTYKNNYKISVSPMFQAVRYGSRIRFFTLKRTTKSL